MVFVRSPTIYNERKLSGSPGVNSEVVKKSEIYIAEDVIKPNVIELASS